MTRDEADMKAGRDKVEADVTDERLAEKPDHPRHDPPEHDPDDEEASEESAQDQTDASADDAEQQSQETRRKRRPTVLIIALLVLGALALGGIYWWLSTLNIESTDDAFTDGRAIAIAPQVAGRVVSLDVTDNQFVRKGQALVHLDPRQFINARDQMRGAVENAKAQLAVRKYGAEIAKKNFPAALQVAQANLASAKANLERRQADFARQKSLPRQATTQQDVDTATANLQQAQAQVLQAQAQVVQAEPVKQNIDTAVAQIGQQSGTLDQSIAQLHQADLDLSHTVVRAPQDGWVTRRNVEMGNYITAGQQIMSIVSPDVWVVANFKETQLNLMRPGQSVQITVDAYPDLHLRGHVDSIQLGSGSKFTAFPAENATGNFVKIVQRVPVKIIIDSGLDPTLPLPLGLSVEPTVTVR